MSTITQTLEVSEEAPVAPPRLGTALLGFALSTMLTLTVMVLLSA